MLLGSLGGGLLPAARSWAQAPAAPAAPVPAGSVALRGTLTDGAGQPLVGAAVFVKALALGTAADEHGAYALVLPRGTHAVTFSFVGYQTLTKTLKLTANQTYNVRLSSASTQTSEVVVTGSRAAENVRSTAMGTTRLDMKTVKLVPALFGEVDVIRTIQLLPGVSTVGEGAAGCNLRGGNIYQNLVLLDEAPIYNSSHLFGFFSVFNPDAVKDLTLVKGGIPASYGGRLSSVLDVRMRAANPDSLAVTGGVGLVSSRLAVDVPLIKNKLTLLAAGRRSYADLFLTAVPSQRKTIANFSDLSVKVNYDLGPRDQLSFTGYRGNDAFGFSDDFNTSYGNTTGTLRLQHTFGPRLALSVVGLGALYDNQLGVPTGAQGFKYGTQIRSYTAKADLSYQLGAQSTLSVGAASTWYRVAPGKLTPTSDNSIFRALEVNHQTGRELAAYADHDLALTPSLSVRYGLRVSAFQYTGAARVSDYVGVDGEQKTPVNPRTYGAGSVITTYPNLEPRVSVRLALSENSAVKASYNRMAQYLHLLSNSTASSPFDIWTLSTTNTQAERADQVALGYFRNFAHNAYEASVEVFGKKMTNQVDFIDGANLLLNQDIERDLLYGRGRAYGAEFYLKKNTGPLTGWVSYTLSHSQRQVNGINNGAWYDAKYDRRHVLAVVGIYALSPRWSLSGTFNYSTGVAATVPDSRFLAGGLVVPNLTGDPRNNYRVPAYHRLDLGATRQNPHRPGARYTSSWTFSIYNLYARRNAFSIYFRQNADNPAVTEAVRLSVLGTALPSATYNFNF